MKVFPVQALIPQNEYINQIVTLGPSKLPEDFLVNISKNNNLSYLRVVKPSLHNPDLPLESEEYFNESLAQFNFLVQNNYLTEIEDTFFFYQQIHHTGYIFSGWILSADANDYKNGNIKRHEKTIKRKANKLEKHIEKIKSIAEPVLLTTKLPIELQSIASELLLNSAPELTFIDQLGNSHSCWRVMNTEASEKIRESFEKIDSLYIADGHHRIASISQFLLKHPEYNDHEGIMSLVIDSSNLLIKPFYRLLKNIDSSNLFKRLREIGLEVEIMNQDSKWSNPLKGEVYCISKSQILKITLPQGQLNENAIQKLDVIRIERLVFNHLFDIADTTIDQRVSFLPGDRSSDEIFQLIKNGEVDLAFTFAPNTFEEIKDVADANLNMPPKSTFIEPKLPIGFIVEHYR